MSLYFCTLRERPPLPSLALPLVSHTAWQSCLAEKSYWEYMPAIPMCLLFWLVSTHIPKLWYDASPLRQVHVELSNLALCSVLPCWPKNPYWFSGWYNGDILHAHAKSSHSQRYTFYISASRCLVFLAIEDDSDGSGTHAPTGNGALLSQVSCPCRGWQPY